MGKRKKRLAKQIKGLLLQVEKHEKKAETQKGRKDTTKDYWLWEAGKLKERAREREEMLKKL